MFLFSSTPAKKGSRVTPLRAAAVSRRAHKAIDLHQHPIASFLPTHRCQDACTSDETQRVSTSITVLSKVNSG